MPVLVLQRPVTWFSPHDNSEAHGHPRHLLSPVPSESAMFFCGNLVLLSGD